MKKSICTDKLSNAILLSYMYNTGPTFVLKEDFSRTSKIRFPCVNTDADVLCCVFYIRASLMTVVLS